MSRQKSSELQKKAFVIGNMAVQPGKSATGELPLSKLVTGTQISLPLQIFHGKFQGPVIWISAALHGDEVSGVEIIRQVTMALNPKEMGGTLIAVPIVNVHGFLTGDRYLPDRRDLNRSFPGSPKGSMAAIMAHLFMTEIVSRCDLGIDLHTGSDNRINLPQIRTDLENPKLRHLSEVFGASVMLHARVRDGSLRGAAIEEGALVLLYEGGEVGRFEETSINAGYLGIMRVLADQGFINKNTEESEQVSIESRKSSWIRAKKSGIALIQVSLGDVVSKGQLLGVIHDSVGKRLSRITSNKEGIIIGKLQHPLVNQGDALIHIAEVYTP